MVHHMLIRVGGVLGGARQPVEWIGTFPRHARSDKCLVSCSSNRSGRCKHSHMHSGGREGGRQPVEWISDVLSFMSAPIDSLVVSHHGGGYTRQVGGTKEPQNGQYRTGLSCHEKIPNITQHSIGDHHDVAWSIWGALQPRDVAASAPQAEPRALVVVRLGSAAWTVNQRNDSEVYRHGCHPLS